MVSSRVTTSVDLSTLSRVCSTSATTSVAARVVRTRTPARRCPLATIGLESVAHAALGLDRVPAERLVDLASNVADVDLDDVVVTVVVGVPDVLQDVGLAHHLAGVPHQVLQQPVLPRRELDRRVAAVNAASTRVEPEVSGGQDDRPLGRPSAYERTQPRHQHRERERLRQVVVGAEVERVDLVEVTVLRGEHDDRSPVLLLTQPTADVV